MKLCFICLFIKKIDAWIACVASTLPQIYNVERQTGLTNRILLNVIFSFKKGRCGHPAPGVRADGFLTKINAPLLF